jgi:hypothetical protein
MPWLPAAAPLKARPARPTVTVDPVVPFLSRWLDLQTATVALRYRDIRTNAGVTTSSQLQDQEQIKFRVKLDTQGRYGISAGLFTGNTFTAGWNNTGLGAGDNAYSLTIKQLFVDAQPVRGIVAQVGSLYFWRGESTEITTFDNDGYVTGERASIKRPETLFLDEILVTRGYLGDLTTPNFFRRTNRIDEANYRQFAVAKTLGKRAGASLDYSVQSHAETLRGGVRTSVRELRFVDTLRLEGYRRLNQVVAGGLAISGEKAVTMRYTAGFGYATIDPKYGAWNGERYGIGRHLFAIGTLTVSPELSFGYYVARGVANDFRVPIGTRVEIIGTYNVLKRLQRAHVF